MTKLALVMVHGRAQGQKDPAALEKEWIVALKKGLGEAHASVLDGVEIRFPFYGKKLDDLAAGLEEEAPSDLQAKGDASGADQDFLRFEQAILERALEQQGIARERQAELISKGVQPKGPGSWEWVQELLRLLDNIPGLSSAALAIVLRDVFVYLNYSKITKAIDDIVAPSLTENCVIIAHSLGTVITYKLLKAAKVAPTVPQLLTLGSPLGVSPIRQAVMPLKFPKGVGAWNNMFDERDVVALYPLDKARFGVVPPIVNDDTIKNETENHHGIVEYLNKAVVAALVHKALTA